MNKWKNRLLAAGIAGAMLTGTIAVTPKRLLAQVKYALVRDEDSPGRNAFQTSVTLNLSGTAATSISIPSGKRLVIDYVAVHGFGPPTGTQPYVILQTSLGNTPAVSYYLTPTQSPLAAQQFETTEKTAIYGDSALWVGLGYSGYAPALLGAGVSISGHLIDMP